MKHKILKIDFEILFSDADGPIKSCGCSWMCHPETCGCNCHG